LYSILLQRYAGRAEAAKRPVIGIIFDLALGTVCFRAMLGAGLAIDWKEIKSLGRTRVCEKEVPSSTLGSGAAVKHGF
jgi:hypothetical protein